MKLANGKGDGDGDGLERSPKSECRENDMSHLSCDCLQRCHGKSLRISNEITRNDCSQGFPNEIDASARALELSGSCSASAGSVQRALARIMAVVEDEAKMRRRHYAVDCHTGLRRGRQRQLILIL